MAKKKKKEYLFSPYCVGGTGDTEEIKRSVISQDFYFNSIKALAPLPKRFTKT